MPYYVTVSHGWDIPVFRSVLLATRWKIHWRWDAAMSRGTPCVIQSIKSFHHSTTGSINTFPGLPQYSRVCEALQSHALLSCVNTTAVTVTLQSRYSPRGDDQMTTLEVKVRRAFTDDRYLFSFFKEIYWQCFCHVPRRVWCHVSFAYCRGDHIVQRDGSLFTSLFLMSMTKNYNRHKPQTFSGRTKYLKHFCSPHRSSNYFLLFSINSFSTWCCLYTLSQISCNKKI